MFLTGLDGIYLPIGYSQLLIGLTQISFVKITGFDRLERDLDYQLRAKWLGPHTHTEDIWFGNRKHL